MSAKVVVVCMVGPGACNPVEAAAEIMSGPGRGCNGRSFDMEASLGHGNRIEAGPWPSKGEVAAGRAPSSSPLFKEASTCLVVVVKDSILGTVAVGLSEVGGNMPSKGSNRSASFEFSVPVLDAADRPEVKGPEMILVPSTASVVR
jgi:hypothetical protein